MVARPVITVVITIRMMAVDTTAAVILAAASTVVEEMAAVAIERLLIIMKKYIPLAVVCAAAFLQAAPGAITTEKDFLEAVRMAMLEKSGEKISALTYMEGASDADKAMLEQSRKRLFNDRRIESITLEPIPESQDVPMPMIMNGKKIEMTCKPLGVVKIKYEKTSGSGLQFTSLSYGKVGDAWYLVGPKSTDLGWKGPPDKPLGYMVMGGGQNNAVITVKYNASGVDVEQSHASASMSFYGQYISEIIVKSENPKADLTITIRENGKEIDKAGPFKGAGEWKYTRKK
jgi:hypothetical protein